MLSIGNYSCLANQVGLETSPDNLPEWRIHNVGSRVPRHQGLIPYNLIINNSDSDRLLFENCMRYYSGGLNSHHRPETYAITAGTADMQKKANLTPSGNLTPQTSKHAERCSCSTSTEITKSHWEGQSERRQTESQNTLGTAQSTGQSWANGEWQTHIAFLKDVKNWDVGLLWCCTMFLILPPSQKTFTSINIKNRKTKRGNPVGTSFW